MVQISAALVKQLREKTGAAMMDCKQALMQAEGNLEAASDWLRTKGLALAARKAGRISSEGVVVVALSEDRCRGAMIELNAETDFVARNQLFQELATDLVQLALIHDGPPDLPSSPPSEQLLKHHLPSRDQSVKEALINLVAKLGENITWRWLTRMSVKQGMIGSYIHQSLGNHMGRIGVMIALDTTAPPDDSLEVLAKQLSMHIAARRPQAIESSDLPPDTIERERQILLEQARESGKPTAIVDMMVEGRMRKYYEEVTLMDQIFVIDNESRVREVVAQRGKDLGSEIKVKDFVCLVLGSSSEPSP